MGRIRSMIPFFGVGKISSKYWAQPYYRYVITAVHHTMSVEMFRSAAVIQIDSKNEQQPFHLGGNSLQQFKSARNSASK